MLWAALYPQLYRSNQPSSHLLHHVIKYGNVICQLDILCDWRLNSLMTTEADDLKKAKFCNDGIIFHVYFEIFLTV